MSLIQACWSQGADVPLITLLDDQGPRSLTGAQLRDMTGRYASALAGLGVKPGDRVGLVLQTSEEFLGTLFGTWWLGAAVVPLAPPFPKQLPEIEAARLLRALSSAQVRLAIVTPEARALLASAAFPVIDPAELALGGSIPQPAEMAAAALIQYSSGSTGRPKGVVLNEQQIIANLSAVDALLGAHPGDVGVSWLPLYHDMGLMGGLLYCQLVGIPLVLMPPDYFIRMPLRWLQAISDYRGTLSVAPHFAYQLCSMLPRKVGADLDLSSWRIGLVGAEPIRPSAIRAFVERYRGVGLHPSVPLPTYGLAEATVAVAMATPGVGMATEWIERDEIEVAHRAVPAASAEGDRTEMVAVGAPLPGIEVEIRDDRGERVPDRQIGEIWVRSPAVMQGYYADPGASAEALSQGMLRTGDLGYLADGQLYVSGRIKDMIIRGGRKYYPQDLEEVAESHEAVRPGGSAAFLVPSQTDREQVVLMVEAKQQDVPEGLAHEIRMRVLDATGLRVDEVALVPPYHVPKTTSGKIMRSEARRRFLSGLIQRLDA